MECTYDVVMYPTDPANTALLRKKYAKKPGRFESMLTTPERAQRHSFTAKWWRKGEKERWDETYAVTKQTNTKAFDGNVVREVRRSETGANAGLRKLETSHLRDTVRHQPFALVFELLGEPFSEVIGKGRDYKAEPIKVGGEPSLRVFVRHPSKSFCLLGVIDVQGRLAEWSFLNAESSFDRPVIRQTCLLLDYQGHADPSGETIWFPRKVHLRYFDPANKDGPAVEWGAETITCRDVRFNIDIPDSQFMIVLPADAEVYDDVTGQGFLPAGTALPGWKNPPQLNRSWTWWWVAGSALLALLVLSLALIVFRRWRASRAGG
jgi:hypothetical protein